MRPLACIPLGLLASFPFVAPAQLPLHHASVPTTQSFTLIEALSADPDYLSLLKLVQRAKLVPTLTALNDSTFFAPTNDAIKRHVSSNLLWKRALDDDGSRLTDNLHLRLRQELFYHLLNYTLPIIPTEQTPQQHKTLLYPRDTTEPPTQLPPPYPPWMPIPNGTLGEEPQRLRLSYRDEAVWAGVDASGNRGVKVVKDQVKTSNGLLLGLDEVLEMPPDLATVISRHPRLSYFSKILTPELTRFLNSTPTLTLFLPEDDAWQTLPSWERVYLESEFASDDLLQILNLHAVVPKEVKWSDSFTEQAVNFTTIHGRTLEIVPVEENKIKVSEGELVERDVYASNGVLHTVSSLLVPPGALRLTPEKYLLGLNCTEFVSLIHSVNLTHLINDPETQYTILAPRDDVLKLFGHHELPHRGSEELKRVLEYHFIPGKWAPKKLQDGMLVETALEEPGLAGRQVMTIEVTDEDKKKVDSKAIRFAGAGVMGDYMEINNTIIYFVSRPLVPPGDVMETALPNLELSTFIAGIFSTNLAETLKATPRTTLLMPPNGAFRRLGMLVSNHLLASSSKADLERVIRHHALVGVEYAEPLIGGSQRTFATLEGSDLHVERRGANRTIFFTPSGGWADMQAELYPRNMLTQTGVIHEISDIMIPRSVQLTVGKLVKAAKGTTMTTMMVKAGFGWILNGTAPPEGSHWAEMGLKGSGWTLLCPTDDAFKQINLTDLYANEERLQAIVAQHLIPTPSPPSRDGPSPSSPATFAVLDTLSSNRPLPLEDSATYATLQSLGSAYGDVLVRVLDGADAGAVVVGIKGARGRDGARDWARVLDWGRSTTGDGSGGVVQVDRLLVPYTPTWYEEYGAPVGVGVGGVVLIVLFFLGVRWVWRRDTTEATYEPVGGFGHDDAEE
ncbi:FAS1 domain-containing protein [Trametes polyzona]|nr:FAS1 domain-containing protein [Trametes polyzona]